MTAATDWTWSSETPACKGSSPAIPLEFREVPSMSSGPARPHRLPAEQTTFAILFAVSFCHLLNDMMQALLPAIYPTLKTSFHLNFTQIGLVDAGVSDDRIAPAAGRGIFCRQKPMPFSLPIGMVFTLVGLARALPIAQSYGGASAVGALVGLGSSVFHPKSSRVARMASGGRHGLAQSLFQVGGNIGSALGPLTAALIVLA